MRRLAINLAFMPFVALYVYSFVRPPDVWAAWGLFAVAVVVFVPAFLGSLVLNARRSTEDRESLASTFDREQEATKNRGRFVWDWDQLPLGIATLHLMLCVALASIAAPGTLTQYRGEWVIMGHGNHVARLLTPEQANAIRGYYLRCALAVFMVFVSAGWSLRSDRRKA